VEIVAAECLRVGEDQNYGSTEDEEEGCEFLR